MNNQKINKCGCGGAGIVASSVLDTIFTVNCASCYMETNNFTTKAEAIESWNTAHPEISNAMQAVKLLEEGKCIYNESFNNLRYFKMINGTICSFNIDDNKMLSDDVRFLLFELFNRNWELYEEPKYKEVDYFEAIELYENNTEVFFGSMKLSSGLVIPSDCEKAIDDAYCYFLESNDGVNRISISVEMMKSNKWRIYEN